MVINIKKILLFLCLFFLFNTLEIDSDSDKKLIYNNLNIYDEDYYRVYFYDVNNYILDDILNNLNIRVLSYIIDGKKYYARNIQELFDSFTKDKILSEKIYYEKYGVYIDGVNIVCNKEELIKLSKLINMY